jgi:ketosteroid isomerase-like protein
MVQVDRFVARFEEIWSRPDPERFRELWTDDGVLLHPGMREPLPAANVADYVRSLLAVAPDLTLRVERWAARDDSVLIEWTISGGFRGETVRWSGVDRFTLRGERAVEGVAYFDTLPLWARIDPSMQRSAPLEEVAGEVAAGSHSR